jgi:hypothetical protein
MAFQAQRVQDITVVMSPKKQLTYGTGLADGLLTVRTRPTNSDAGKMTKIFRSDVDHIKGNEFATKVDELSRSLSRSLTMDANSDNLGIALAFAMGGVVTIQPDMANDPNAWEHTMTFQPSSGTVDAQVTTINEEITADVTQKLVDMAVQDLTLRGVSGPDAGPLVLTTNWLGSGVTEAGMAAVPALAPELANYFSRDAVFSLGTEGAPTDISEQILEWELGISQSLDNDGGYFLGSGKVKGRTWYGPRRVTFSFVVHMKETDNIKTLFDGVTQQEIKIEIDTGVLTSGGVAINHLLEIRLPQIVIPTLDDAEEIGMKTWRVEIGFESVMTGQTLTEPLQVIVTNEEIDYLQDT